MYRLSDDEDSDLESDEEGGKRGGLGIRDGMNKIGAFFSNFTAPKGEGMGNPGPTSHPHLFPTRTREGGGEEEVGPMRSPRRSPVVSRVLRREVTRDGGDDMESLNLPPSATAASSSPTAALGDGGGSRHDTGTSKSGASTPRVLLDLPSDDGPPVSPGSQQLQ